VHPISISSAPRSLTGPATNELLLQLNKER
jgi:hypothetical protein